MIYHRAKIGEGRYEQQRVPLAAFGPKATELAQYRVGQVVTLGGFIRPSEHGLELIVMRHELTAQTLPTVCAVEEIAPERAAEVQPEVPSELAKGPVAVAPKTKGRGRKKIA